MAVAAQTQQRPTKLGMTDKQRRNLRQGLMNRSPWILGFLAFMLYPIIYSLFLSFTLYTGFGPFKWIGLQNYQIILSDNLFWTSLYNTVYYTVLAVPIGTVIAIIMALAMNQRLREVGLYRTALYLPSVLPIFALSFIFIVLLNPQYGLVNYVMTLVGLQTSTG